jgi:hypothetical protein
MMFGVEKECKVLQVTHAVQSLFDALMRQTGSGTSAWWEQFTPIKVELAGKEIMLLNFNENCALQRGCCESTGDGMHAFSTAQPPQRQIERGQGPWNLVCQS